MIEIIHAETRAEVDEARKLFREYEAWLGLDLCFQGFEEELANLPGKYAKPDGRLFLAFVNKKAAGCIAFRRLEKDTCEMKRLYIRDEFRGRGLGKLLIEKLIAEAGLAGYKKMRLDTLPGKMAKAVKIYQSHGFREIPAYYQNPYGETLFMERKL
ncbi:MAG TPA: GNAT family N-acetyltransferase [Pyrinomonadaceae bacterium]|jgi:ribosomal protein S18 acetylase RimI-like enzyme